VQQHNSRVRPRPRRQVQHAVELLPFDVKLCEALDRFAPDKATRCLR
jgi:hypothetical protein